MTTPPTTTTATTTEHHLPNQIFRAHDILDEEVTRTTAERDALRQFRARCTRIDPDSTTPSRTTTPSSQTLSNSITGLKNMLGSRTQHTGSSSSGSPTLQEVRDAYRETVMAVPYIRSRRKPTTEVVGVVTCGILSA
jgi:hypothetical protein